MNKQIIFKKRPIGNAGANTWELQNNAIPEPKDGEVLIQNHYISLDPANAWLDERNKIIHSTNWY